MIVINNGGREGGALPTGFRFFPTDEELIMYYLRNQAANMPCLLPDIIPVLNIYKHDPWYLPRIHAQLTTSSTSSSATSDDQEEDGDHQEWYFFSPRDGKYPNGARPNRATASGYWKATGTDKPIYSCNRYVGIRKALVFYRGKPPKGIKTEWIMHEYRLANYSTSQKHSMETEWALCRIYRKKNKHHNNALSCASEQDEQVQQVVVRIDQNYSPDVSNYNSTSSTTVLESNVDNSSTINDSAATSAGDQVQLQQLPRSFSIARLLDLDNHSSAASADAFNDYYNSFLASIINDEIFQ